MDFELFFNDLLKIYKVKTITDLAEKLNMHRSTVSGWKNRETFAPILEYLFLNDKETLKNILNIDNSKYQNEIKINDTLLKQTKNEASKFGLDINSYIEHLIIQDLKK